MTIYTHFSRAVRTDLHLSGFEVSQIGQIVGARLDEDFFDDESLTSVSEKLNLFNGFYAICWSRPGLLFAAVDQVRSFPLFYAIGCTDFYLSDSAEWVKLQIGDAEMCKLAKQEFVMTGCVTGPDTLYKNVKQLQAGEVLEVRDVNGKTALRSRRYYNFKHTEPAAFDEELLLRKLNAAASSAIDNLISFANGRQIVVPLSGGFDSRLIATLLKEKKYPNVLTFSYGLVDNKESLFSKEVASSLGLEWIFVEYNSQRWGKMVDSPERWKYQLAASNLSSLPHIQDWIAVEVLKSDRSVEKDCIFVPGHSADFVAGSHIPERAFIDKSFSRATVLDAIFDTWFTQCPLDQVEFEKPVWLDRISRSTPVQADNLPWEYADRFEHWDWQERQAKYICNSVRVYEFFGYSWWMPFWDRVFMDFWLDVPLQLRQERVWYKTYVQNKYLENVNLEQATNLGNAVDDPWVISYLRKSSVFRVKGLRMLASMVWQSLRRMIGSHDSLALGMLIPVQKYRKLDRQGYKLLGMLSLEFLGEYADLEKARDKTDNDR